MVDMTQLENAIWRIADGRGNDEDVELLRDGGATSLSLLARLIGDAEDGLASARDLASRVRSHIEDQTQAARVPAGAPNRRPPGISAMTPEQKIRYGLAQRQE